MALPTLTKVNIANMALSHLGNTIQIESLDDANVEAEQLKLHYDNAVVQALELIDWPFARRRLVLTTHPGTPPNEWGYQYLWPTDCVKIRKIYDEMRTTPANLREEYAMRTEDDGTRVLYCDVEDACVVYTYYETDTAKYSASFSNALSWLLALRVSNSLVKSRQLRKELREEASGEIDFAIGSAHDDEEEGPEPQAPWITERGYSG